MGEAVSIEWLLIVPVLGMFGAMWRLAEIIWQDRTKHFTDDSGRVIATVEYSPARSAWTWNYKDFYCSMGKACAAYEAQKKRQNEIRELEQIMKDTSI